MMSTIHTATRQLPGLKPAAHAPHQTPQEYLQRLPATEERPFTSPMSQAQPLLGGIIQTKLTVGAPDDVYEQEADAMADRVVQGADAGAGEPLRPVTPGIQRKCAACQEEEKVQRKPLPITPLIQAKGTGQGNAHPQVQQGIAATRGGGTTLDGASRQQMEQGFGHDFSAVRIHTSDYAAQMSRDLNARAFTVGNDIYFNRGEYQPGTKSGQHLLAHELTHTVQQGGGGHSANLIQRSPGSPAGGCGLCYGGPQNVGIAAHTIIQQAFIARYPFLMAEGELSILNGLAIAPGDEGRLDLLDITGPMQAEIGEIKPANAQGLFDGERDLIWYTAQLQAMGFNVRRMNLPPPLVSLSFPTRAPANCPQAQALFIDAPIRGTYTYFCEPDYSLLIAECDCEGGRRVPRTVPVPVPRTTTERIRQFIRETIDAGGDAEVAIRNFLIANQDLISVAIMIGVAGLIALFAKDIATFGAGLIADIAAAPFFIALIRIANQLQVQFAP